MVFWPIDVKEWTLGICIFTSSFEFFYEYIFINTCHAINRGPPSVMQNNVVMAVIMCCQLWSGKRSDNGKRRKLSNQFCVSLIFIRPEGFNRSLNEEADLKMEILFLKQQLVVLVLMSLFFQSKLSYSALKLCFHFIIFLIIGIQNQWMF